MGGIIPIFIILLVVLVFFVLRGLSRSGQREAKAHQRERERDRARGDV